MLQDLQALGGPMPLQATRQRYNRVGYISVGRGMHSLACEYFNIACGTIWNHCVET